MQAIQIISQDLFDKIRSRFQNLELGDKTGAVTLDPAEARFFDFDFVNEGINLGRISVSINDLGSLKIFYSQGITEGKDNIAKKMWYSFLKEMRLFAMRRLLRFDTRDITKTNLDKNDFQYLASKQISKDEDPMATTMNESRWMLEKSSKKTSRAVKGRTQVIVRHTESMAERKLGDRSNPKKIKAIYIENSEGERFKYPFIHTTGAFAMAQHVDHGGVPHDPAGKAIIKMSEQIAQLQQFRRHVQHTSLHDDAMGISERAVGRLNELKIKLEAIGKRRNYEAWAAEFNEQEMPNDELLELDPVTLEDYKSKFTQTNFKEEIAKFFPLLHSIMQEKIDLEEYVEETIEQKIKTETTKKSEFETFVEWAEAVEQGRLDLEKINNYLNGESLQDALSRISLGADGINAWSELSSIFELNEKDIDDEDLKQRLFDVSQHSDVDQTGLDSPAIMVFKNWVEENFPEWQQDLPELFSSEQQPQLTPEPETGMQPAPAPQAGVNPNATPGPTTGMNPAAPVAEGKEESMIEEIAKLVKMRYNAANETVGPFNGHEGILLDVEKTISEKFGEKAGEKARMIADSYMKKLTQEWQQRHGETINSESHNDTFDPKSHQYKTTMKHAERPTVQQRMAAHDIKPGIAGYRDRIDMLQDLERTGKSKPETDEGMLDKVKSFGKKVLDKVAPDDATLLKKLEKDSGGRIPPKFEPKPEPKNEMAEILKLSGIKN
jgi:hypothetical protein